MLGPVEEKRKVAAISRKYSFLARRYTNLRNGISPTGGTIEITQSGDGTFKVTGFNPDGTTQWESILSMSPEDDGVGTATYRSTFGESTTALSEWSISLSRTFCMWRD